jgi:hypothetical protein
MHTCFPAFDSQLTSATTIAGITTINAPSSRRAKKRRLVSPSLSSSRTPSRSPSRKIEMVPCTGRTIDSVKVARDQRRLDIVIKDRADAQHLDSESELHILRCEYAGMRAHIHAFPEGSVQNAEHEKQRVCVLHAWHVTRQCTFDVQRFVEEVIAQCSVELLSTRPPLVHEPTKSKHRIFNGGW